MRSNKFIKLCNRMWPEDEDIVYVMFIITNGCVRIHTHAYTDTHAHTHTCAYTHTTAKWLIFLLQLMCLIEAFGDGSDKMCGAVVSIRPKQNKISIWTGNAKRKDAILHIG